jgi:hypothetical protein
MKQPSIGLAAIGAKSGLADNRRPGRRQACVRAPAEGIGRRSTVLQHKRRYAWKRVPAEQFACGCFELGHAPDQRSEEDRHHPAHAL